MFITNLFFSFFETTDGCSKKIPCYFDHNTHFQANPDSAPGKNKECFCLSGVASRRGKWGSGTTQIQIQMLVLTNSKSYNFCESMFLIYKMGLIPINMKHLEDTVYVKK